MSIGDKRDRVTIEAPTLTQNAIGEPVDAWAALATVWAAVRDISGREFMTAQATQNQVVTKIYLRYRADIAPDMRVVHGATVYRIEAVLAPMGRTGDLVLMCSKGGARD